MPGPPPPDALELAELLAGRLCHELAGPAGSLAGTLELAIEDRDFDAVAAAQEQAALLVARLRLLRAAWGAGEAMDTTQLRAMLVGLPRCGRVRTDLDQLDSGSRFPPPAARLLLNVLLLAGESLPRGGRVALTSTAAGIEATLHGERAAWPPELAALPDGGAAPPGIDARRLQAPLTALMASAAGITLTLTPGGPGGNATSLLIGL